MVAVYEIYARQIVNSNVRTPEFRTFGSLGMQNADAVAITGGSVGGLASDATVAVGLVAAGSIQGDALAITADFNQLGTVALDTGVILPTAVAGKRMVVRNDGVNAVDIYPATGGQIDGGGANAPLILAAGGVATLWSADGTDWFSDQ